MRYFNDFYKNLTIASNGRNVKRQRQKTSSASPSFNIFLWDFPAGVKEGG